VIVATSTGSLAVSVAAVVASGVFVLHVWQYRSDPLARPLIAVAFALLIGAVVHLAVVDLVPVRDAVGIQWSPTDTIGGPWLLVAFDLPAVVGGLWFLFALQYTGRDGETSPIAVATVGVLLLCLVAPTAALAVLGSTLDIPPGTLNALLGVTLVLAESLALIGVFLILATTLDHRAFPTGQTALLTLAVSAVLAVPFVATTLQLPVATPAGVAVSSIFFTGAIGRYRVFETVPVASVVGRDRVVDEMSDGVVLVGSDGKIRDCNPEAASLFDLDRSVVVGDPLETALPSLPDPESISTAGPTDVRTASGTILSVTADAVTDERSRTLGHLLVCRDVTEQRRREHRLGVLTQLLAGATQRELSDVAALAAGIADGERDAERGGDRIHETATGVATLVARVRDIEHALADRAEDGSATADVTAVLADLRESVSADVGEPPTASPPSVAGDPALLTAVLETLVTSAAVADDTPSVRVDETDEAVEVTIAPVETGDRSLGDLAVRIARRATTHTDWRIRVPEEPPRSRVIVGLPVAPAAARTAGGEGA